MNEIQNLLNQLSAITKGYKVVSKNSKNDYNIFKILNLQSDEVNLHSLFLAELLNPSGSHHLGTAFLECFIDIACPGMKEIIDLPTSYVTVEKFIGPISEDKKTGGRIDIIIEDRYRNCIIIENKIYAGDQEKQLLRYHNYKGLRKGEILYLTLNGTNASELSCCNLVQDNDYKLISYAKFITKWLGKCHQLASDIPFIRESIQQYIYLIKTLTGQTMNNDMYQDIKNIVLNSKQNLESAFTAAKNFDQIKTDLLMGFWDEVDIQIQNELKDEYTVLFTKDKLSLDKNYPAIFINEKQYFEEWLCQFCLEPLNGKSPWAKKNLYYGIWINSDKEMVRKKLLNLQKLFDGKTSNSNWWLDVNYFKTLDFSDIETLKGILPNSESRTELIEKIVKQFCEYILLNKEAMKKVIEIISDSNGN